LAGGDVPENARTTPIGKDRDAAATGVARLLAMGQPQRLAVAPAAVAAPMPAKLCCLRSDTPIVGNIVCDGPWQVFCDIRGELRGTDLLIADGAQVVGSIVADEVTIRGRVTGTVRAARVKLEAGGAVAGDIFHQSLSVEEDAVFEGLSRPLG
jgi:cytoskeletal protein CcmA (bactofilin family)